MTASQQVADHIKIQEGIFKTMESMDHEQVAFFHDRETGLKAIVAIHSTVLGPALGGTRFWNYPSEYEAVWDVLRLSRGMTFKASLSGVHLGGGKAVILGDPQHLSSEAFWRRYGKFLESLNGKYITAEDVGTNTAYMAWIALETESVAGKPDYMGGGGDPSPVTAYGTYLGMKAAAKKAYGNDGLSGKIVWVEGAGHVGSYLIDYLCKEGAHVLVSDIREQALKNLAAKHPVEIVTADEALQRKIDIYSPNALGATLNDERIEKLSCAIVAGAANNQLADEQIHGHLLQEKGILYAPDFLINSGGLINCFVELEGYNHARAMALTEEIYSRTTDLFSYAEIHQMTPHEAALALAQKRIQSIAHLHARR